MTLKRGLIAIFTLVALAGGGRHAQAQPAETIYTGGDIITMAGRTPFYAQALAVRDGKIAHVGSLAGALRLKGRATRMVDLGGKTMLPGFIDGHGHMVYFGKNMIDADLVGTPDVVDLVARMKVQAARTPPGAWIVGFGYSTAKMADRRHPTRAELDAIAADRPIMVVDASGHLGSANSAAFREAGISADTPDPEGGNFARIPGSKELLGAMEETALFAVRAKRPPFTGKLADDAITGAAREWARHGHTTAQECGVGLGNDDIDIIRNAIDRKLLPIDLYLCAKDSATDDVVAAAYSVATAYNRKAGGTASSLLAARPDLDRRYINRVRLGGIKFWLDGSPDTGWFSKPFANNPPGKTGAYFGFQQVPDDVLFAAFDRYWATGMQINMHVQGDAAAEQALRAIEAAVRKHGMRDHRPVFIHATYMRPDQIRRMKAVGGVPTYLTGSIPKLGEIVIHLWGPERAHASVATRTLLNAGMPFTFSHDAPVSPSPSVLVLVDAGVNRIMPNGSLIGGDERISPYDALRAVTVMAAYQIREEASKGILRRGKLADLVILDKNPLKVDPKTIRDIAVVETIKEGQPVFRLQP